MLDEKSKPHLEVVSPEDYDPAMTEHFAELAASSKPYIAAQGRLLPGLHRTIGEWIDAEKARGTKPSEVLEALRIACGTEIISFLLHIVFADKVRAALAVLRSKLVDMVDAVITAPDLDEKMAKFADACDCRRHREARGEPVETKVDKRKLN